MINNEMIPLEILDLTLPRIPPRSQLYPLTPIGLGTAWVEALTSYIARIALAHSVSIGDLVRRLLVPLWGENYLLSAEQLVSNKAWSLNGISTWTSDWVRILQELNLRNDLRFLTVLLHE